MTEGQVVASRAIRSPVGVHPLAAQDFHEQSAGDLIIINHAHAHGHLMFLIPAFPQEECQEGAPEGGTLPLRLFLVKWRELEALQHTVEGAAIDVQNFGGPRVFPWVWLRIYRTYRLSTSSRVGVPAKSSTFFRSYTVPDTRARPVSGADSPLTVHGESLPWKRTVQSVHRVSPVAEPSAVSKAIDPEGAGRVYARSRPCDPAARHTQR
jgi:hypothetical protein